MYLQFYQTRTVCSLEFLSRSPMLQKVVLSLPKGSGLNFGFFGTVWLSANWG